jgi:hypothetical protein
MPYFEPQNRVLSGFGKKNKRLGNSEEKQSNATQKFDHRK